MMSVQFALLLPIKIERNDYMRLFRNIYNPIKWAYQRVKYGWCDRDLWNMDCWFLDVIIPMLKRFKEIKHGYPANMTLEQWNSIVDEMIMHFENCDENNPINHNEKWDRYFNLMTKDYQNDNTVDNFLDMCNTDPCTVGQQEAKEEWLTREQAIYDFRKKEREQAFKMFCEYFESLWD